LLVFVSDLHLRDGGLADDLDKLDEENFCELIDYLIEFSKQSPKEIELILLGDTFDLWEIGDFFEDEDEFEHKMKITQRKIDKIAETQKPILDAMKKFQKIGKIVYVTGNHDADAEYDEVRTYIIKRLGIDFIFKQQYKNGHFGLVAEHGHRFNKFNSASLNKAKTTGRLITENVCAYLKELEIDGESNMSGLRRPYVNTDRVFSYGEYFKCMNSKGLMSDELAKTLYDRLYKSAITTVSRKLQLGLRNLIFSSGNRREDVIYVLNEIAKRNYKSGPTIKDAKSLVSSDVRCVAMGHTHKPLMKKIKNGALYINTGTWKAIGTVDPKHPACFRLVPSRHTTILYHVDSNKSGKVTVKCKMFRFPESAPFLENEYKVSVDERA